MDEPLSEAWRNEGKGFLPPWSEVIRSALWLWLLLTLFDPALYGYSHNVTSRRPAASLLASSTPRPRYRVCVDVRV
ncbi:hypothetical protein V5799_026912 [Amblyomma americanum]|uniref:Uncharacterized protein n=1 Tax=Amblyomma americanum TaxID=6943 RepID=A0AAQ4DH81_AMBAM